MESSGTTRRVIGYILLTALLVFTGWAVYVHMTSPLLRALTSHADETLYTAILTKPAMTVAYNPHNHKAILTVVKRRKLPTNPLENAQDLFRAANLQAADFRYYIPRTQEREIYWEKFKENMSLWRFDPLILGPVMWEYILARRENRTNLNLAEFLLYSLTLTRLEITDFTLRHTDQPKKKRGKTTTQASSEQDHILPQGEDRAPLAVDDRPLVIEILNASGQKGAALKLTQYLRDQSQKGLLRVDVLQYDNYPGDKQPQTQIIDYAGRLALLKQLSTAIGVNNEIISEKQDSAICDARVIIGEDFKQPL